MAVLITLLAGIVLYVKKVTDIKWNLIYIAPFIVSLVHFFMTNRNVFMYLVYFASCVEIAIFLLRKKKVIPLLLSLFSAIIAIIPIVLTLVTHSHCYASLGYADAFTAFHKDMEQNYALQEWKETDFDEKYETYIGLFEEAEKNHDKLAYIYAMLSYLASYQDGHVQLWDMYELYGLGSTRNIQNTYRNIYKNYYGMTLIQLDSGEYVAANVEESSSASLAGIQNGTVIQKWNGKTVSEQITTIESIIPVHCYMFADTENIERFKPFILSCMGEEKVEVEFVKEDGQIQEVTLETMGNGYSYLYHTIGLFLQEDSPEEADFYYNTLAEKTGYLQVKGMGVDFEAIRSKIEGYIAQMKEDQISSLIIDVRNNAGGEDQAGAILAEQFATEDMFYLKETIYDKESGQYQEKRTLRMEGKSAIDVPIYLLVNSNCISAGEGFAYNLAKLPQVTVVGIQGTNGSFGTIDGIDVMPEGMMGVFPSIACLDENGEIMIDSRYQSTGGIKPELTIPIDQEAVKLIFTKDYDYELEYLLQFIHATKE